MKLEKVQNPVVYFCTEFAIDNDLPTYSGGLGVLAGDLMHQAAIEHFPMVGIGILYKGKDFIQHITGDGKQETRDSEFDHDTSFLRHTTKEGIPLVFELPFSSPQVKVKSYHLRLSDTTILFFLSTDIDGNPTEWIKDMDALYRGDANSQIRQQILLGVGGVILLEKLDIKPSIYHINEGRPAFLIWELVKKIVKDKKIPFEEAWNLAKQKIVYTNHTLVAAGNPTYPKELIEKWATPFAEEIGVETEMLIKEGLINPTTFALTDFALNISSKQSAVSKIHAKYAKEQYPNFDWIAITNGINPLRWQDSDFRRELSDREIWNMHMAKKEELMATVVKRTGFGYDTNRLVVTWARRLAEYKQPKIIFQNLERLKKILKNPDRPVQLLFAGNTHTFDQNAKSIIEEIIKIFSNELSGYAIFIPNYNISLANHLTSGSDVWLNTPKGNLEACGTSGMKAMANGVLNATVLDGWTYEVDWKGRGWVLDPKNVSDSFYDLLENEIAPLYYKRNQEGLPIEWIKMMRASIELSKDFSTERTFKEYKEYLYRPLQENLT